MEEDEARYFFMQIHSAPWTTATATRWPTGEEQQRGGGGEVLRHQDEGAACVCVRPHLLTSSDSTGRAQGFRFEL